MTLCQQSSARILQWWEKMLVDVRIRILEEMGKGGKGACLAIAGERYAMAGDRGHRESSMVASRFRNQEVLCCRKIPLVSQ